MIPASLVVADIGGTHLRIGHATRGEAAPETSAARTDVLRVPDPVAALAELLDSHLRRHHLKPDAVVIGLPVSLARDLDLVLSSPNVPQLEGLRLGELVGGRLGRPTLLERDVILHLLGEACAGGGLGFQDVLGVFFGTGVGAAYLEGGRPHRGHPVSVELGHIPVRAEGRRCVCGNTDCLEAYACGHTLRDLAAGAGLPVGEIFLRHAEHPALKGALADFVRDQAYAVATAVNLLGPEVTLIGGGIPDMPGYPRAAFVGVVREHLRRPQPHDSFQQRWASLGWRASLHGAQRVVEQRWG
ncbi:ROK family protein [Deinococcus koreensis]|uniref:ROK family protein n=1 Tax=Deinococcus koreensis TaxID=2054903 RepID=A0A2K3UT39_9DEIO|nr:ROK family protein [Deinococcus koreensis]PNY79699.1 ROK family protein [Deinococcus koreensis]